MLDVTRDPNVGRGQGLVVLDVESDADLTGCPYCGAVAVGRGRHVQVLHDAPYFGTPVRVPWRKRIWRCPEPSCRRGTRTEEHDFAPPRAFGTALEQLHAVTVRDHQGLRPRSRLCSAASLGSLRG
ncbi:transposase family protein [Streptomyces sp. CA-106131]|uniref:transposase family protein n=1 Tax=Streptomyces sp. CA-106131 TaxID=3240045 RepID=UPI003D8C08E5